MHKLLLILMLCTSPVLASDYYRNPPPPPVVQPPPVQPPTSQPPAPQPSGKKNHFLRDVLIGGAVGGIVWTISTEKPRNAMYDGKSRVETTVEVKGGR